MTSFQQMQETKGKNNRRKKRNQIIKKTGFCLSRSLQVRHTNTRHHWVETNARRRWSLKEDSPDRKYIGPYHSMPIPLRTLRFIHSTYTWTCIGRGSIPRVAPSTAYAQRSSSTLLAPTRSSLCSVVFSASQDVIRPRPSHSKRPSVFPKYGIWSQISLFRGTTSGLK